MKIIEKITPQTKPSRYHGLWYYDNERNLIVTAIIPLNLILVCLRNIYYFVKLFGVASDISFYIIFERLKNVKLKFKNK